MKLKYAFLILLILSGNCYASLTSSLVGWWKLNDNALTTTVVDSAGSNTGTFGDATGDPNTNAHNTAGKINGALTFDGTDDYIDIGDVIGARAYTKVAWVKRADGVNLNNIISTGNADYSHVFWAPHTYSYKLSAGNMDTDHVQDDDPLAVDVWYQVAVTFDPAVELGKMVLYKNSVPVDSNSSVPTPSSSPKTYIGRYNTGYNFNGTIDNVMIFNRALTAEEIKYLYNGGIGLEVLGQRNPRGRYSGNRRTRYNIN